MTRRRRATEGRIRVRRTHTGRLGSLVAGGLAAACVVGSLERPARGADDPATTTTITVPKVDHRVEVAVRGGVQFPGEVTPKNLLIGQTGVAPVVFADVSTIVHPFFTLGVFTQFSSADYQHTLYGQSVDDGRFKLLSAGASFKARIPIGEAFVLRVGALLGPNLEWASGSGGGASYSAHGAGLDFAATVEGALRVSQPWGLSAQLAFTSQPVGSISIDGDSKSHDSAFAPLFFLAIGPELYL